MSSTEPKRTEGEEALGTYLMWCIILALLGCN